MFESQWINKINEWKQFMFLAYPYSYCLPSGLNPDPSTPSFTIFNNWIKIARSSVDCERYMYSFESNSQQIIELTSIPSNLPCLRKFAQVHIGLFLSEYCIFHCISLWRYSFQENLRFWYTPGNAHLLQMQQQLPVNKGKWF